MRTTNNLIRINIRLVTERFKQSPQPNHLELRSLSGLSGVFVGLAVSDLKNSSENPEMLYIWDAISSCFLCAPVVLLKIRQ